MSANPIQPNNYPTSSASQFERLGHPGKWLKSISVTGGATVSFTGSNYGAGGIITYDTAAGTAYLSDGGSINVAKLAVGSVHELSIEKIEGGTNCYVLIRNQVIR